MERHESVSERTGWLPRHLGCFDGGVLIGAMPLYEKHNSWGEFVFDHIWAEVFHRTGTVYYPKLVNAIPFTPAYGQRILAQPARREEVTRALLDGAHALMRTSQASGLHCLFVDANEFGELPTAAISRIDCQFHWYNCNYRNFDEFLATLKAKKRKNIRHERAKVAQSGVVVRHLDGNSADETDWRDFTALYQGIYMRKYGYPAFNQQFFMAVSAAIPEQIQLLIAYQNDEPLAAALMYSDDHSLYGRHWGCHRYIDSLHFELCYYRGIEICIERGLQRFDSGAQGEHKIARGFIPVQTHSLHWLADDRFMQVFQQFAEHEKTKVMEYIEAVNQHLPYRFDPVDPYDYTHTVV